MKPAEIVKLVRDTWANSIPKKRMAQLAVVRGTLSAEDAELFDSVIDTLVSNLEDDPEAISLMLIHGIQTDGAWHEAVKSAFRDVSRIKVKGLGYDCVTPLQLACPFRKTPIKRIVSQLRDIRSMEPNSKIMVIAHSFGTYIVSRILSHYTDIKIDRIILCGSIVRSDFRWDQHTRHMADNSIVNDVGTRDFYPVLATFATVGYGGTGRKGFGNTRVIDRFFDYEHSDFFCPSHDHINTYWKPYIVDGTVVESAWNTKKPGLSIPILMACHPWIGRPVFYAAITGSVLGAYALINHFL